MALTENLVLMKTKLSSLEEVKNLNLWGAELADISLCKDLVNLEVLALSVNHVTSLADIAHCKRLRELYLRKNDIGGIRQLTYLSLLPRLNTLWLNDNPVAREDNYRLYCIKYAPALNLLDTVEVTADERSAAAKLPELESLASPSAAAARSRPASSAPSSSAAAGAHPKDDGAAAVRPPSGAPRDRVPSSSQLTSPNVANPSSAPSAPSSAAAHGRRSESSSSLSAAPGAGSGKVYNDDSQRALLTAIVTLLGELSPQSMELLRQEIGARQTAASRRGQ